MLGDGPWPGGAGGGALGWIHSGHACKCRAHGTGAVDEGGFCFHYRGPGTGLRIRCAAHPGQEGLPGGLTGFSSHTGQGPWEPRQRTYEGHRQEGRGAPGPSPSPPERQPGGCWCLLCGSLLTFGISRAGVSEEVPTPGPQPALGGLSRSAPTLGWPLPGPLRPGSLREGDCALLGFFLFSPPPSPLPSHPQRQKERLCPTHSIVRGRCKGRCFLSPRITPGASVPPLTRRPLQASSFPGCAERCPGSSREGQDVAVPVPLSMSLTPPTCRCRWRKLEGSQRGRWACQGQAGGDRLSFCTREGRAGGTSPRTGAEGKRRPQHPLAPERGQQGQGR